MLVGRLDTQALITNFMLVVPILSYLVDLLGPLPPTGFRRYHVDISITVYYYQRMLVSPLGSPLHVNMWITSEYLRYVEDITSCWFA